MSKSIATKTGDRGQTGLVGGARVSKASLRVETYGTVDELNSFLGFARSICEQPEIKELTLSIQKELFIVGGELATPGSSATHSRAKTSRASGAPVRERAHVTQEMVDRLTSEVHRIEAVEGILSDWTVPGEDPAAAAFDMARAVCRRAERCAVRLAESEENVGPLVVVYLNRLSDLVWLLSRWIEMKKGANAALREKGQSGPRWSRAW
jgi:cob(I)alamin adenosyltransferase